MRENIELPDTICLMLSKDYKERFIAEYWQMEIRRRKLDKILAQDRDGTLSFEMTRESRVLLRIQIRTMSEYLEILETRATNEGVDLTEEHAWRLIDSHQISTTEQRCTRT